MLAQFFLSREVSGKDSALEALNRRVEELTSILALERSGKSDAEAKVSSLSATLAAANAEDADLKAKLDAQSAGANGADARVAAANDALDRQKALSADALAQVDALNQQIIRPSPAIGRDSVGARRLPGEPTRNRRRRSPTSAQG